MSEFKLEKWYLDVTDSSSAFIGYAARLSFKALTLAYSGYTLFNENKLVTRNSFLTHPMPEIQGETLVWSTRLAKGAWTADDASFSEVLLEDGDKSIFWECLFPKAAATVAVADHALKGFGYAEKINLTFMPWHLPIERLHWGRFLSESDTIIWIKWEGPLPRTVVYHNGRKVPAASISEFAVAFEDYDLTLSDSVTMRKGTIGSTVFKSFPSILKLFPKSIFQLKENKWYSQGVLLKKSDNVRVTGHSIHELVIWK